MRFDFGLGDLSEVPKVAPLTTYSVVFEEKAILSIFSDFWKFCFYKLRR